MKHLILLYYFASISSGFIVLVLLTLLYKKYRDIILLALAFLLIVLSVYVFIVTIDFYFFNVLHFYNFQGGATIQGIDYVINAFVVFLIPYCTVRLMGARFGTARTAVFSILSLAVLLLIFWTPIAAALNQTFHVVIFDIIKDRLNTIITLLAVLYTVLFIFINIGKINEIYDKYGFIVLALSFILFDIMFFWEAGRVYNPRYYYIYGPVTSIHLFYLFWNLMAIYYGSRYLLKKTMRLHDIPAFFINKFGITDREREIIVNLSNGLANKEIAYELEISVLTVKNHIHNIYQKTGAKSKVELLNRLDETL